MCGFNLSIIKKGVNEKEKQSNIPSSSPVRGFLIFENGYRALFSKIRICRQEYWLNIFCKSLFILA